MNASDEHEELIELGLALHEARDYTAALSIFQRAIKETPECVAAQYNIANTLHMLGRDTEASAMLRKLLSTSDETFRRGCPLEEEPAPFKLDALYLLFLTTLYETESWDIAFPYALKHLHARSGDVESVFSDEHIENEINSLKSQYQT